VGIEKEIANVDKSANNIGCYDDVYNVKVMYGCHNHASRMRSSCEGWKNRPLKKSQRVSVVKVVL